MKIQSGLWIAALIVTGASLAACQTTSVSTQKDYAEALSQAGTAPEGEKPVSLDEMLDEHETVTLTDEDGDTRLICKRFRKQGSRVLSEKVCATKKQWEAQRRSAKEDIDQVQRGITKQH